MKVLVLLEAVFTQTPDGRVWSSGVFTTDFFARYLSAFTHVVVGARIQPVTAPGPGHHAIHHKAISFIAIPWYRGFVGFLRQRHAVLTALHTALAQTKAVIMRVPSPLAGQLYPTLRRERRPFGVEVVGDPWDSFAPRSRGDLLRMLLRRRFRYELQQQCLGACAAAYVTERALQQRYPAAPGVPVSAYSSIELGDESFVPAPRGAAAPTVPLRLISVGTMSQRYKGYDVLMRAMARCRARNLGLHLTLVGDGVERPFLEHLRDELGLAGQVTFVGHLADPQAVRKHLDDADAFVLASRTEGLPRVIIEAMARALPCLGTRVGGIPELLPDDALVPPGDDLALSEALCQRLPDAPWMIAASARNLERSRDFHAKLLTTRRTDFYAAVRAATHISCGTDG